MGVTVGDGQVIAFDGYGGATAGAYCSKVAVIVVDNRVISMHVNQCVIAGVDGVCVGVEFGIFSIDIDLRLMQDVVISCFAVSDGVAVSVIAAMVFILVDVAVTVQVHVGAGVFHKGELLDFLISTTKVDGGACITVNSGSSWTAGSSSNSEGVAFNVDYWQGIIGFQCGIFHFIDICCAVCGSSDGLTCRGNCCIFGADINKAAIVAVDGVVSGCSEVFTVISNALNVACQVKVVDVFELYLGHSVTVDSADGAGDINGFDVAKVNAAIIIWICEDGATVVAEAGV